MEASTNFSNNSLLKKSWRYLALLSWVKKEKQRGLFLWHLFPNGHFEFLKLFLKETMHLKKKTRFPPPRAFLLCSCMFHHIRLLYIFRMIEKVSSSIPFFKFKEKQRTLIYDLIDNTFVLKKKIAWKHSFLVCESLNKWEWTSSMYSPCGRLCTQWVDLLEPRRVWFLDQVILIYTLSL